MASMTTTSQHGSTARMDSHDIARILVAGLGPTLVAAMTGSKDRKLPAKWAKPDGPTPRAEFLNRLQLGHRIWASLVLAENEHVARSWFIGGNPFLQEATPITAIREGRSAQVMAAAEEFLKGNQDA